MRSLVVGATGALGVPVVKRLVAAGHEVFGLTRSAAKQDFVRALGATPVIADALDKPGLHAALKQVAPEAVVHLLTSLPKSGPRSAADIEPTNLLRTAGTANLVEASVAAGVRRLVAESIVLVYGYGDLGDTPITEDRKPADTSPKPWMQPTVDGGKALEATVLQASGAGKIEGIVLRYGYFYGAEAGSTLAAAKMLRWWSLPLIAGGTGVWSWIHIDDAASATVAAIERGRGGEIYNIVDDEPVTWREYMTAFAKLLGAPKPLSIPRWLAALGAPYAAIAVTSKTPMSNAKAKRELAWSPAYPTYREGLAQVAAALNANR